MSDYRKLIGTQIDNYQVEAHIASGGMADVYRATDRHTGQTVALKILFSHYSRSHAVITRFQREAEALVRLNHPNIIQMFGTGRVNGSDPYIAMEYIPHGSLAHQLITLKRQGGDMESSTVLNLIRQIADALTIAHRNGIVHRDLKPANILIRPDGTPVLTDLGIAMIRDAGPRVTRENQMIGTPDYMSPEQVRAEELDGRSDIYSLGVVMYELFAGQLPFSSNSAVMTLHQHLNEPPPPLQNFAPGIPPQAAQIVNRCLEKDPANRYQSTAEISNAISAILRGDGFEQQTTGRSYTTLYAILGAFVAGLAAFAIYLVVSQDVTATLEPPAVGGTGQTADLIAAPEETDTPEIDQSETKAASEIVPAPTTRPTSTNVPLPTITPEIVFVTATPEPAVETVSVVPTETPIPPTETVTPTATLSEFAGKGNGLPIQFENDDSWIVQTEGSASGSLTVTAEEQSSGDNSGRLAYEFQSAGDDRLIVIQENAIPSNIPIALTVQVFGDGSGHDLSALIIDADGEQWETSFGSMTHSGWAFQSAPLLAGNMTHLSGPDNGQLDQPLTFYAFVLSDGSDNINGSGVIYIDSVFFQSAATSTPRATATPIATNTPIATPTSAAPAVTLRVVDGFRCDEQEHQTTLKGNIGFKWQSSIDDSNLPAGDRFVVTLNGAGGTRSISFESSFSSTDGEWFVFVEPATFGLEVNQAYTWFATYLDKDNITLGQSDNGCFSTIPSAP
ncbi:MAG: serine/threonine protein kinase [Anaerolineae bacterium]